MVEEVNYGPVEINSTIKKKYKREHPGKERDWKHMSKSLPQE
jgi:hypothetical protein